MRSQVVDIRAPRHYCGGIDRPMGRVVMGLDMIKIYGVSHAGKLIDLSDIGRDIRVVLKTLTVALEVSVIHRVKSNQRSKQADIRLGERVVAKIAMIGQVRIDMIQLGKHLSVGLRIGILTCRKAGPINAVVNRWIDSVIPVIDILSQSPWVQIQKVPGDVVKR